jgi:hypothetical protein
MVRGSHPGGAKIPAPVQTGPEAHPAARTMGTEFYPEVTPLTPDSNPSAQRYRLRIFIGDFNFKGLTAQRLYKSFGSEGLSGRGVALTPPPPKIWSRSYIKSRPISSTPPLYLHVLYGLVPQLHCICSILMTF